jgi:hypothetical protein
MLIDKSEKKGEEILFTLFHSGRDLFFAALLLVVRLGFLLLGILGLGFGFFCHVRSPMKERQTERAQTEFASNAGFTQ